MQECKTFAYWICSIFHGEYKPLAEETLSKKRSLNRPLDRYINSLDKKSGRGQLLGLLLNRKIPIWPPWHQRGLSDRFWGN